MNDAPQMSDAPPVSDATTVREATPVGDAATPPRRKASAFVSFLRLSSGYWFDRRALKAWLITAAVVVTVLANVGVQVANNKWQRAFFDALETRSLAELTPVLWRLPALVAAIAIVVSAMVISRMTLQAHWRAWLTERIAGWWIADQRYYRLGLVAPEHAAPEYRIAEDVRLAIEPLVDFVIGIASAAITALTFAAILWQVAGSISFEAFGRVWTIPAYMAIAAVLYAVIASAAAFFTGRPLVRRVSAKNEAEAQFRAEMTRLRENAESIALIRGDADELSALKKNYARVLAAWMKVIGQQARIAIVLNTNGALFGVVPLLLAAPKYLAGELTMGAVVQVAAAFAAVQGALIWFVDNFVRLAEWYASATRVMELTDTLADLDAGAIMESQQTIAFGDSEDGAIHLENLSIADRGGRLVIKDASTIIAAGEKVTVMGESGSGKSTLIRAIAGLWPWGSGTILLPKGQSMAFVPQKPYIPLGALRQALLYPAEASDADDAEIQEAMKRCGLAAFIPRLDDAETAWDRTLSGGERQRVAFCRLLIQKPQIIIMDEATSALDEDSQTSLLSLLHEDLAYATVVSVGHRLGMEDFHERKIELVKQLAGAQLTSHRLQRSLWRSVFRKRG